MQRSAGNMSKSSYDTDDDGVVDKSEGVRVVDDYPESPSLGDVVVKDAYDEEAEDKVVPKLVITASAPSSSSWAGTWGG